MRTEESQYENFIKEVCHFKRSFEYAINKYLEKIHVVGILIFSHTDLCICLNAIS